MALVNVTVQLSPKAEAILRGAFLDTVGMGGILGEILEGITGDGLLKEHFQQGQSEWPELAEVWREQKQRQGLGLQKFRATGQVFEAITQPASTFRRQAALYWGGTADLYAGQQASLAKAVASKGVSVRIRINKRMATLSVAFVGKLKQSKEFRKLRRDLAKESGWKYASTSDAELARRQRGLKVRKYSAMGAAGFSGGKFSLARGKDNLGYANLLQLGRFMGIRNKDTGQLFKPQVAGKAAKSGKIVKNYEVVRAAKKFPLLPLKGTDGPKVLRLLEQAAKNYAAKFDGRR